MSGRRLFEVEIPRRITAPELDRRMAQGWFRAGPVFFRAEMLAVGEQLRGLVHIRLPLVGYVHSRSKRRLLRRSRERFRCEVGPARVDAERRHIYDATKPRFIGFVARDLEPLVFGVGRRVFDTHECAVYDGDRLVAVSYFDVGRASVSSQLGLHDPDYARFGLGIYTLLEEIEHARSIGARFFYPGYVIPGLPALAYKLQLGPVQYRTGSGRWRARSQPPARVPGHERYVQRIAELRNALDTEGVAWQYRFNPAFWMGYLDQVPRGPYLRGIDHFRCGAVRGDGSRLVIEYSAESDEFTLCWADIDADVDLLEDTETFEPEDSYETRALVYGSVLARSSSPSEVARAAGVEAL